MIGVRPGAGGYKGGPSLDPPRPVMPDIADHPPTDQAAQPTSAASLLAHLADLGIAAHTVTHRPVFTVAESKFLRGQLPGGHCKSLFVRDKRGGLWLIVADEDTRVDLNGLARRLGAGRFSFASPEAMWARLGVRPGSVTPFGLINDRPPSVSVVLEARMMRQAPLHYHPLVNHMTTAIAPADLVRFIEAGGHRPQIVELDGGG